jgi:hypothetical protein
MYYGWSKKFVEAGKRRLTDDMARSATTDEVKGARQETSALKEAVAEQALEIRLLKKVCSGRGKTTNEIPRLWGGRLCKNNRAAISYLVLLRRERKQQTFKYQGSSQRFLAIHTAIYSRRKTRPTSPTGT